MARHDLLKKQLDESPSDTLTRARNRKAKLLARSVRPNRSPLDPFVSLISHGVGLAIFQHLGFGSVEDLSNELNESFELALHFFSEDWWQAHEDARYVLDRSTEYPVQSWYQTWMEGLLLADWTNRWEEALTILEWVDDNVARGVVHGDPFLNLYLFVSSVIGRPLSNQADISELVESNGDKFEKLLLSIWQTVENRDTGQLAVELPIVGKQFRKAVMEDVPNLEYSVSLDMSLLWTAASRLGMTTPNLSPEDDAIVVRSESIWS